MFATACHKREREPSSDDTCMDDGDNEGGDWKKRSRGNGWGHDHQHHHQHQHQHLAPPQHSAFLHPSHTHIHTHTYTSSHAYSSQSLPPLHSSVSSTTSSSSSEDQLAAMQSIIQQQQSAKRFSFIDTSVSSPTSPSHMMASPTHAGHPTTPIYANSYTSISTSTSTSTFTSSPSPTHMGAPPSSPNLPCERMTSSPSPSSLALALSLPRHMGSHAPPPSPSLTGGTLTRTPSHSHRSIPRRHLVPDRDITPEEGMYAQHEQGWAVMGVTRKLHLSSPTNANATSSSSSISSSSSTCLSPSISTSTFDTSMHTDPDVRRQVQTRMRRMLLSTGGTSHNNMLISGSTRM